MSNAIGVDACANLLRDYIDEIILKFLAMPRDQSHAKRPQRAAVLHSNELRARILGDSEFAYESMMCRKMSGSTAKKSELIAARTRRRQRASTNP